MCFGNEANTEKHIQHTRKHPFERHVSLPFLCTYLSSWPQPFVCPYCAVQSILYASQYWRHDSILETPFSLPFLMYTSHTSGVFLHTFFVTDPVWMPLVVQRLLPVGVAAAVVVVSAVVGAGRCVVGGGVGVGRGVGFVFVPVVAVGLGVVVVGGTMPGEDLVAGCVLVAAVAAVVDVAAVGVVGRGVAGARRVHGHSRRCFPTPVALHEAVGVPVWHCPSVTWFSWTYGAPQEAHRLLLLGNGLQACNHCLHATPACRFAGTATTRSRTRQAAQRTPRHRPHGCKVQAHVCLA